LDLVAAVLVCGGVAAMVASGQGLGERNPYLMMTFIVVIFWLALRARRTYPTCDECGRRFEPPKRPDPAISCPRCGEAQSKVARALRRWKLLFWAMTPVIAICAIAALIVVAEASRIGDPIEGPHLARLLISGGICGLAILTMVWARARRSRLERPQDRTCEACGELIPQPPAAAAICPNCLNRRQTLNELEEDQAKTIRKGRRTLALLVGMVSVFVLAQIFGAVRGSGNWKQVVVLFVVAVLPLLGVVLLFAYLFRASTRWRWLTSDEGTLAIARECAGEDGTIVREEPRTIWYSGPEDPIPMLLEEIAAAHQRFATVTGDTDIADPPIRILCFHERDGLVKFQKALMPRADLSAHLGMYFQRPYNLVFLCTSEVPGRLDDPRTLAGNLYDLVLMEQVYGTLPIPWLQSGLVKTLAARGRRDELVRLNRKMVAALASGTAYSEDLFAMSASKLSTLLLRTGDPSSVLRAEQFVDQSWSIVEYLSGEPASEARRAAFHAFLRDKHSRSRPEESFFRRFGFGFGSLLDEWREWVLDQGIGRFEPSPPRIRDAIAGRVLPIIRDRHAPRADRIQAIREWRKAGFAMGADGVVELLREPGDIPKDEIIGSLRAVSGLAWGDEPGRWQAWWDELESTFDEPSKPGETNPDRLPLAT
jgi:predicted RNA-binding Zn-ribbon protein involved in translation (DUF1610 family)